MPEGPARKRVVDVFISHAGEQKETHAYVICKRLEELDTCINVFLDELSLEPGGDPDAEMRRAMKDCAVAVFFLTRDFVRKWWPMHEIQQLLHRTSPAVMLAVICTGDISYDELYKLEDFYDVKNQAPHWEHGGQPNESIREQRAEQMRELLNHRTCIRQDQAKWGLYEMLHKVADKVIEHLGRHNRLRLCPTPQCPEPLNADLLVDMDSRKQAVRQILDTHGVALIHGMVGIGKTVLAKVLCRELVKEDRDSWSACLFWCAADNTWLPPVLQQVFDDAEKEDNPKEWLQQRLGAHKVLLVIDGARDRYFGTERRADLMRMLAPGSKLIVTSRDSTAIDDLRLRSTKQSSKAADCKYVPPLLALDDACKLFRLRVLDCTCCEEVVSALEDDQDYCKDSIEQICTLCGRLPMAIAVVADKTAPVPLRRMLRHLKSVDRELSQWLVSGCDTKRKAPDDKRMFGAIEASLNIPGTSSQLKEALVHVTLMLKGATKEEATACCRDCEVLERHALVTCAPNQVVEVHQALLEFCLWALKDHPQEFLASLPHPVCMVHKLQTSTGRSVSDPVWPLTVQALHFQNIPLAAVTTREGVVLEDLRFLSIACSSSAPLCMQHSEQAEPPAGVYQLCHVRAAPCATSGPSLNTSGPKLDFHLSLRSQPTPGIHCQDWPRHPSGGVAVVPAVQLHDTVQEGLLPPVELHPEDLRRLFTDTTRLEQLVVLRLSGLSNTELLLPVLPNLRCASIFHMPLLTELQHLEHLCGYTDSPPGGYLAGQGGQLSLTVAHCSRLQQLDLRGGSKLSGRSTAAAAAIRAVLSCLDVLECSSLQGLHGLGELEELQELSVRACPELAWCDPGRVGELHLGALLQLESLIIEGCAKVQEILGLEGLEAGPCPGHYRYCY